MRTATVTKRPYQAPRIVSSEAFERLALACNGTSRGRNARPVKTIIQPPPSGCTAVGAS